MNAELTTKLRRLQDWLGRHGLGGVLLWSRANFAWITCGRDNHIANNSPVGVAAILATPDRLTCLCSNIEAARMRAEELSGAGIDVIDYPWHDPEAAERIVRDAIAGRAVAADADPLGLNLPDMPGDFVELRWSLTDAEIARYREGARRTSAAIEAACRALSPGLSGHDIAGILDHRLHGSGLNPLVTLVAVDDQVERFRHPIPKDRKLARYAMLVSCAEFHGLVTAMTRFVHFGPIPEELRRKQRAVANIECAIIRATRPARTLGAVFSDLRQAYAEQGFADEWMLHHQGGSIGYATRDVVAKPGSTVTVRENQAFAWNPSITGAKSEDTVLVNNGSVEVLSAWSPEWPTIEVRAQDSAGAWARPDVLVL